MPILFRLILAFTLLSVSFGGLTVGEVTAEEILTWGDCLAEARKNNPELISAAEGVNEERASKDITASGLYPQISADAGVSTTKTTGTTDSYSYGVSGSQLIFDGLKSIHDLKAASENLKAKQAAYRFTSSEVRFNLRSAFINLLKAQELIRVAEEIAKIRRDSLILITLQHQSGLEHKGALLTAEANLAKANFELSQAKRDVEFSQRQLIKEMGRRDFEPISVRGEFIVNETAREKPDFEELVKNNPSLLQAAFKKNSRLLGIKSAYGDFAPELSASAGAGKKSSQWPPEDDQWNIGLSLKMPLFEGGLKTAQVSKAQALFNQAEADERSIRNVAIVTFERTWKALQDTIETVNVQRKSLEAAEERSRIAEAQYSTGFISFDNWIIIEDDLVMAKKSYLEVQANALLAEANWIQAKGGTIEYAQ